MKKIYNRFTRVLFGTLSLLGFAGMAVAQCLPGEEEVTIDVTTDGWGYECYWELVATGDPCGGTSFFTGGNIAVGCAGGGLKTITSGGYGNNATVTEGPWCLAYGDYDILSVDDWGDGSTVFEVYVGGVLNSTFTAAGANSTHTFTVQAPPDNDLMMNVAYYDVDSTGTFIDSTSSTYYTMTPIRQASQDLIFFGADIVNNGLLAQPNVMVNATVNDGTNDIFSEDGSVISSLASSTATTELITVPFTPTNIGTYNMTLSVSSDSTDFSPSNNSISRTVNVNDTVYARDQGASIGGFWFGGGTLYNIGQLFEIFTTDTATSISVLWGTFMPAGSVVSYHIWDATLTTPVVSATYHALTAAELGTWVTLPFDGNVEYVLQPGVYIVGYETFSDTVTFEVGAEDAPMLTTFVDVDKTGSWGYTTRTLYTRLNTKQTGTVCAMSAAITATDVNCPNDASGTVKAAGSGGTTPYTYLWDDPGTNTTDSIGGLSGGTYSCIITDASGCVYNVTVAITEPSALVLSSSSTDITCFGGNNGVASVTASGATAPYTYLWNDTIAQTTANATGLLAGTYQVVVSDANGCPSDSIIVVVSEPAALILILDSTIAVCGLNGSGTVTPSGGTAPFTYQWDDSNNQTDSIATGLTPGIYNISVLDAMGCSGNGALSVPGSPAVTMITGGIAPTNCTSGDGIVYVNVTGGTAPFGYQWSPINIFTDSAFGLSAGMYTILVIDSFGCQTTESVNLVDALAPSLNVTDSTDVSCIGGSDGDATASVSGGTGPYDYYWSNGDSTIGGGLTNLVTGLSAGSYNVTVTDANSCSNFASTSISEPSSGVTIDSTSFTDISCNGLTDGTASVYASGGSAPLTYVWASGPFSTSVTGLGAGKETITVSDANGCSVMDSVNITDPPVLAASVVTTDIKCYDDGDGAIDLTVTGGTGSYTYLWSNSETTEDLTNLTAIAFQVTVTDENGCIAYSGASINESPLLVVTAIVTDETIDGANDGAIDVTVTGGTGAPYTYFWNPGSQTTEDISNLADGTYDIAVTDGNNCTTPLTSVVQKGLVGIEDVVFDLAFNVYPNPNDGNFVLVIHNLKSVDYNLEVRNIIGQLVYSDVISNVTGDFKKEVNMSNQNRGVYFLSIINEEGKRTEKLIIF